MELVKDTDKTRVNGHTIVRDGDKYFVHTRGVGYWAFNIGTYDAAVRTAESVSPYLERCGCGAEAHVFSDGKWGVNCGQGCFDDVPATHETRDEAIDAWNETQRK
jgi:hypothetical protein